MYDYILVCYFSFFELLRWIDSWQWVWSRKVWLNVVIVQQHLLIEATITDRVNGLVNRGNEWDEVYKGAKRCLRCPLL